MNVDLPNLMQDTDRHGKPRFYVRLMVAGRRRRIRLKEMPGTLDVWPRRLSFSLAARSKL